MASSKTIAVATELPPTWGAFVDTVALGSAPEDAAQSLGYPRPAQTARLLMGHPRVRKALVLAVQARLEGEAGPLAIKAILDVLGDAEAPGAVKAKLALGVLDRIQPAREDRPATDKPLADMTVSELAGEIERLKDVSPTAPSMRDVTPKSADPRDT